MTRTVQTGYDPETGEPIFEKEEMDWQPDASISLSSLTKWPT